jgi:hypothetical protein
MVKGISKRHPAAKEEKGLSLSINILRALPFDKRAQTCGPSAFLNREEYLMNPVHQCLWFAIVDSCSRVKFSILAALPRKAVGDAPLSRLNVLLNAASEE